MHKLTVMQKSGNVDPDIFIAKSNQLAEQLRQAKQAKQEILELFSDEPDAFHEWTEQDIYEQSKKIIFRWDNT